MRILLLNGPNLGRLGSRQPEIYGRTTLAEIETAAAGHAAELGHTLTALQTNHEGAMIDRIERADHDAIVVNPGAWTHYSWALRDALAACGLPVVEVHISDVNAREEFRRTNVLVGVVAHSVVGKGWPGYLEAIDWLDTHASAAAPES